jgi:hypothetical protein
VVEVNVYEFLAVSFCPSKFMLSLPRAGVDDDVGAQVVV